MPSVNSTAKRASSASPRTMGSPGSSGMASNSTPPVRNPTARNRTAVERMVRSATSEMRTAATRVNEKMRSTFMVAARFASLSEWAQ